MGHWVAASDEALMRAVQRGDAEAFDVLAERLRPGLSARLHDIVRDPGAADDMLQETLLRVWTRAAQWDGRGPAGGWALRIATNLALNHLRTVRRRRETALDVACTDDRQSVSGAIPSGAGPGTEVEADETSRRLRGLVDALPRDKRDVVALACDDDLSVREIADRLGIPEGTVKSRLHHARKWLAAQWMLRENEGKDLK